jgi:PIN domain nuclease of toxin-antitoxin system
MIVLDTHALVWAMSDPKKLGAKTRRLIESAASAGELALSVCSWLELDLLVERRGILSHAVLERVRRIAAEFNVVALPVDSRVVGYASAFVRGHGDPFDLMIVASATVHGVALISADEKLLSWPDKCTKVFDARR